MPVKGVGCSRKCSACQGGEKMKGKQRGESCNTALPKSASFSSRTEVPWHRSPKMSSWGQGWNHDLSNSENHLRGEGPRCPLFKLLKTKGSEGQPFLKTYGKPELWLRCTVKRNNCKTGTEITKHLPGCLHKIQTLSFLGEVHQDHFALCIAPFLQRQAYCFS